jgi:hypothetical protein
MRQQIEDETNWPHLLFVSGESADYVAIEQILRTCDSFSLGPHCWIVRKFSNRFQFAESIRACIAVLPGQKAEMFLIPLSNATQYGTSPEGGFGLEKWLGEW